MTTTTFDETPAERRDGVSLTRLLWVALIKGVLVSLVATTILSVILWITS